MLAEWEGCWRENKKAKPWKNSLDHILSIQIFMNRWGEEIVLLRYNICPHSLFHTCKQQALTVRLGPWGSHSFPLEPAVSNNVCMLRLPKENYTFSFFDSLRDFYLENIYLYLSAAVIGFTASFWLWKRNPCKLLTFFKVSCGARWRRMGREMEGKQSILRESELTWEHFWACLLKSSLWEAIKLGAVRAGFESQIQNFKWLNFLFHLHVNK